MREPVLEISRLTYRYPEAPGPALSGIDIRVEEGEFVVLCGSSGSGKSTLLRVCAGLAPHFFGGDVFGDVVVAGRDTRTHKPAELSDVVGYLFQDPESQVVMGSVDAELALGLEQRGWPAETVARTVEEVTLALGMPHLKGRSTSELSGGELQRVALGSVLAANPSVALLDEPASQLDPVAGDELIALLRRLNEEHGLAVIVAEHRLERCLPAADRVIALEGGRVVCDASPEDFLEWAIDESPDLATPLARMFSLAGVRPLVRGVKAARRLMRQRGLDIQLPASPNGAKIAGGGTNTYREGRRRGVSTRPGMSTWRRMSTWRPVGDRLGTGDRLGSRAAVADCHVMQELGEPAVEFRSVWYEIDAGLPGVLPILRGIDLSIYGGERIALLGRNGAGKSTLLRHLNGLAKPTRGRVRIAGLDTRAVGQPELANRVALLLQNPNDYFLHDRVRDELPPSVADRALDVAGLTGRGEGHPRDLSGGERQRLAMAIILAERGWPVGSPPPVVALDEPTRGMGREDKRRLVDFLGTAAAAGAAVVVATHDVELAAALAMRVVVLGDGCLIADGIPGDVLAGGWYFSTEVARALGGANGAALPEEGAKLLSTQGGRGSPVNGGEDRW